MPDTTTQQEREARMYVACHECNNCGHIGINDTSDTTSACNTCDWEGPAPTEDKCPGCQHEGTMTTACPECGARYHLLAEAHISPRATLPQRLVAGEREAIARIREAAKDGEDVGSHAVHTLLAIVDRLCAALHQRDEPVAGGKPVLWVARAKCDSDETIEGELSVEDISEEQFELHNPDVWECIPLYTTPPSPSLRELLRQSRAALLERATDCSACKTGPEDMNCCRINQWNAIYAIDAALARLEGGCK